MASSKAFSTGGGVYGGPTSDDVVQIELRRMNRILDIDDKLVKRYT
jgi:FAD/FMN-containing dehydrogenase